MEPGNQALNLLQQILGIVEYFVTDQANQLEQLQNHHTAGKNPFVDKRINDLSNRLVSWIDNHEQLQTKFAELLQHLQTMQSEYTTMDKATAVIYYKLKDLELMHKDAIYWKARAHYLETTRKLIFNQYMNLKNGKEDNKR